MNIKDLKEFIKDLPDNMPVASFNYRGSYDGAVAYVDGTGEEDEFPIRWLVVAVEEHEIRRIGQ